MPRPLLVTFIGLLVANIVVWSPLARDWFTQVRYTGPAQEEIGTLRAAAREAPGEPGVLLALAYAYQQAGRYEDALYTYEQVLDLVPSETAALYNTGIILLELGDGPGAEEALAAVLDVNPGHARAASALGRILLDGGAYEDVLGVVLPAAERSAASADLHYLAAVAYENLGETARAEECYRRALQYHPDLREAREGLDRLGVAP